MDCRSFGKSLTLISAVLTWILIIMWFIKENGGFQLSHSKYVCDNGYFNLHPFSMVTSVILLLPIGVSSFELFRFKRYVNKLIHGITNSLAIIFLCIGFYVIINCNINLSHQKAGLSVHAYAGFITFIGLIISYLIGLIFFGLKVGSVAIRSKIKVFHKYVGFYSLLFGISTVLMGLTEIASGDNISLLKCAVVFISCLVFGLIVTISRFEDKNDIDGYKTVI